MLVLHSNKKLQAIIEMANDKKLEAKDEQNSETYYSANELNAIYECRNNFLQYKEQVFSVQEFIKYEKQN